MLNTNKIHCGNCQTVMQDIDKDSIDCVITDPPYGMSFMGKSWDICPSIEIWQECLRVLKPGAFAFVMCIPRQDCLAHMICRLEDAGFNVAFSSIYWTYASGFPKAQNLSKVVDKRVGVEREIISESARHGGGSSHIFPERGNKPITAPATPQAKALDGAYGGFQPKPAVEVVIVAMKSLEEKTYIDQALKNGHGCTWLDDARIPYESKEKNEKNIMDNALLYHSDEKCLYEDLNSNVEIVEEKKHPSDMTKETKKTFSVAENVNMNSSVKRLGKPQENIDKEGILCLESIEEKNTIINSSMSGYGKENTEQYKTDMKSTILMETKKTIELKISNAYQKCNIKNSTPRDTDLEKEQQSKRGRFPANILCEDDVLDDGIEKRTGGYIHSGDRIQSNGFNPVGIIRTNAGHIPNDKGSFSRYFSLDAWFAERIKQLPKESQKTFPWLIVPKASKSEKNRGLEGTPNTHPTCKNIKLMSWLITLASREGDIVLDPFCGSGTTAIAAKMLGRQYIGIEREEEYCEIARKRISAIPERLDSYDVL